MTQVMSSIRSFIMITLCLNPVMMVASEPRFSIPRHPSSSGKDSGNGTAVVGLMSAGFFQKIINTIDLSGVTTVVSDNKNMLGLAVGATGLLLLTKKLKDSEKFGPWCNQQYSSIGTSFETNKKHYVGKLPSDIQNVIWLLEKPFHLLYALIKKYVGMSQATIFSSISSPVVGKLLDCGFACPIPFCSFAALGWASSGVILTKGYFDQSFEKIETKIDDLDKKNTQQHENTQKKIEDGFKAADHKTEQIRSQINGIDKKVINVSDKMTIGFESAKRNAIETKETLIIKIDKEAQFLSEKIQGLSEQIKKSDDKNENALKGLSQQLTEATASMIELQSVMDQKEVKRDKETEGLFSKLDQASQQLANAKEDLVSLVTNLIKKSSEETKKEFEEINKTLLEMTGQQSSQGTILTEVQKTIGRLLDNKEVNDKKITEMLDSLQSSSLILTEVGQRVCRQESVLKNIETAFEKMHKDREELSGLISNSIAQSSEISSRLSKLESQVEQNHYYVKTTIQQVDAKVDTNHTEVIELLKKNNESLSLKFQLFQQESIERENVLLAKISEMEKERKKDSAILRKDLEKTANQFNSKIDDVQSDLKEGFGFFKELVTNAQPMLPSTEKQSLTMGRENKSKKYNTSPYGRQNQSTQEPSVNSLKQQILGTE